MMMPPGAQGMPQVTVLNTGSKRETAKQARLGNIKASVAVSNIVRTTLGPKSMLKMLLDPMGGIVITNDGHAILREIDVSHPAAKSILEVSRSQDEEVGDGTTSVVVLAGELLAQTEKFIDREPLHPINIFKGMFSALDDSLKILDSIAVDVDISDTERFVSLVNNSLDTKFSSRYGTQMAEIAVKAVQTVATVDPRTGCTEIDTKRYAKVEKIPGGQYKDTKLLNGVMINKDVTHPGMRRHIKNPRIVLLDSSLEYKKGESQTNVEILEEADFEAILAQEEEEIRRMCYMIVDAGCDVVVTEKGVSDLAQHFLMRENISIIRRARKTDNNRIARVTGATIVNRLEELKSHHVGTACGLFDVSKIGDEYFTSFTDCKDPKACTIILRGGSKDSLNENERNLHDALGVARNLYLEPRLVPGGGATEMYLSNTLKSIAPSKRVLQPVYESVANAFEVIPRTLLENCGADVVRAITLLRGKQVAEQTDPSSWGVDGKTGKVVNVKGDLSIWDCYSVKVQMLKTSLECVAMITRIDDVLSGVSSKPQEAKPYVNEHQMNANMNMDG